MLIVFPIELKCESVNENAKDQELSEEQIWKKETKNCLGGKVLLAFAYGFPGVDSKIMVKYRANAVMIDQLNADVEFDDENEGVDGTDD